MPASSHTDLTAPRRTRLAGPLLLRRFSRLWPFLLWLSAFYSAWLGFVALGGYWPVIVEHWGIAVAMVAGSYFAGSTPMGGGTIGFPVLVLLFGETGQIGRDFSFIIQSTGLTSASIFILARGKPIAGRVLAFACLGSLISTPLCCLYLAPRVDDLAVKLIFAVLWGGFGTIHLLRLREIMQNTRGVSAPPHTQALLGLLVGLLGGVVAGIIGVGIEMLTYLTLLFVLRTDVRIAVPTAVISMAFTSVVGFSTRLLSAQADPELWGIPPEVYANWSAAAPIVVIGAPLGALVVAYMPRRPTLVIVSVLCLFQFGWTFISQRVTGLPLLASLLGFLACLAAFHALYLLGARKTAPVREP